MVEEQESLESLKIWGNNYFKESFFKKEVVKPKIIYGRDHLQIGRRISDGSIYAIDIKEACRMLFVGSTRCLEVGTLLKTKDGLVKIENAKKVLSYNFKTKEVEEKECIVHNPNKQKVMIIKTKYGNIKCSYNHKFPVIRDGEVKHIEAQNLKITDKLLKV